MKITFYSSIVLISLLGSLAAAADQLPCSSEQILKGILSPPSHSALRETELNFKKTLAMIAAEFKNGEIKNFRLTVDSLLADAKSILKGKGIPFEIDPNGRALIIHPTPEMLPHDLPEGLKTWAWVYQPEVLLDNINTVRSVTMRGPDQLYISHLDLLQTPNSELFKAQVKYLASSPRLTKHSSRYLSNVAPGILRSTGPLERYLHAKLGNIYSLKYFTPSEIRNMKLELMKVVQKELKQRGIAYRKIGQKKLLVHWKQSLNEIRGKNPNAYSPQQYSTYLKNTKEISLYYSPDFLFDWNRVTGLETSLPEYPLLFKWKKEAFLDHNSLLINHDPRVTHGISEVDEHYQELRSLSTNYFDHQSSPKLLISKEDPYYQEIKFDKPFNYPLISDLAFGPDKYVYPVPQELNQNNLWALFSTKQEDDVSRKMILNTYLSSIYRKSEGFTPKDPIRPFAGFAYGLGSQGTLLDFEFAADIEKTSFSEGLFDSYLDFIATIYKKRLKVSPAQMDHLKEVSQKLKSQSRLYAYVQDPIETVASIESANKLNLKAGIMSVSSVKPSEKLPFELLHPDVELPRIDRNGTPFSIAELGRMGIDRPDMTIDFMRIAISKLLEEAKPPIRDIYIEVDEARSKIFQKYGFKKVEINFKDQNYYQGANENLMKVSVDDFFENAYRVTPQ